MDEEEHERCHATQEGALRLMKDEWHECYAIYRPDGTVDHHEWQPEIEESFWYGTERV